MKTVAEVPFVGTYIVGAARPPLLREFGTYSLADLVGLMRWSGRS